MSSESKLHLRGKLTIGALLSPVPFFYVEVRWMSLLAREFSQTGEALRRIRSELYECVTNSYWCNTVRWFPKLQARIIQRVLIHVAFTFGIPLIFRKIVAYIYRWMKERQWFWLAKYSFWIIKAYYQRHVMIMAAMTSLKCPGSIVILWSVIAENFLWWAMLSYTVGKFLHKILILKWMKMRTLLMNVTMPHYL